MATAAQAAREFVNGPLLLEAALRLLGLFPLPVLCEALSNARPEDAESMVEALERLARVDAVRANFFASDSVAFLREGAGSNDARIRGLVAKLLAQLAQSGEAGAAQLVSAGFLGTCERLLFDSETGTAEAAAAAVRHVAQQPSLEQAIFGAGDGGDIGTAGRFLAQLHSIPDVDRMRVLHLFVELGRTSAEAFAALEARGAFKEVLNAFLTDDLLLKLNAVELMDALGSFAAGQELLSREGVPERLASDLTDAMCDSSVRICVTRLLGFVLRRAPAVIPSLLPNREAPLPQALAELLGSRDPADRLCALSTWANIMAQPGGLAFFLRWPELLQEILSLAASPQNEICKGAMGAWEAVLEERPPPAGGGAPAGSAPAATAAEADAQLWGIAERRLVPLVLKNLTGKPFPDVRAYTWRLMASLARSRVAAQATLPAKEVRDLLLDFTSEGELDARRAKYEFVAALVRHHSAWMSNFLDEHVESILQEYARQGPHWVPREAAALVADRTAN